MKKRSGMMLNCWAGADDGTPTVDVIGTRVARLSNGSSIKLPEQQSGRIVQASFERGPIAGSVRGNQVTFTLIVMDRPAASGPGLVTGATMSVSWQYSDGSKCDFDASRS